MCTEKNFATTYCDNPTGSHEASPLHSSAVVNQILDLADIRPGVHVLDVACGTGALFQEYLNRGAKSVTGVDISAGKIAQTEKKFQQPNIHLIRADIYACRFDQPFDRCIIYNALPRFSDLVQFLRRLANCVTPGGRMTIAHSVRLEQAGQLQAPGDPLPEPQELAQIMRPWFLVDVMISDSEKYVVSGLRNDAPAAPVVPATDKR